jgi:hypothetical protein
MFDYEDPEVMDVDIKRIEAAIEKLENPAYFSERPSGMGPG